MFVVAKKLKNGKQALKGLHRKYFAKINDSADHIRKELHDIQDQLMLHPRNHVLQETEKKLQLEYKAITQSELLLLKQKAKVEWLKNGDTNSSFLHTRVKERQIECRISSLQQADGSLLTENADIDKKFVSRCWALKSILTSLMILCVLEVMSYLLKWE